jgi:hypothetical protein
MNTGGDDIPNDWDALVDRGAEDQAELPSPPTAESGEPGPPLVTLMAISWADLVAMLAVCTGALVAILSLGERPALPAFAWSAGLALAWWLFAGSVLVVVRQGTPGMLMAGVSFEHPVAPRRVPGVLMAALLGVVTLGLPGLLGDRRSLLRVAAVSDLVMEESD